MITISKMLPVFFSHSTFHQGSQITFQTLINPYLRDKHSHTHRRTQSVQQLIQGHRVHELWSWKTKPSLGWGTGDVIPRAHLQPTISHAMLHRHITPHSKLLYKHLQLLKKVIMGFKIKFIPPIGAAVGREEDGLGLERHCVGGGWKKWA